MRCDVVRFVAFEDLGVWEDELTSHGFTVRYLDVGVDDIAAAADAPLAIVLGAPIDADDDERYPVLSEVRSVLEARSVADLPTIGICLGAQLMAMALGGGVGRGQREVGWARLTPSAAAAGTPWEALCGAQVLHWHADEVHLPAGAVSLASTVATAHQVFVHGKQVGFQCHPEADPEAIERWLIGHTAELTAWGIDLEQLRAQARGEAEEAVAASIRSLRAWLDASGYSSPGSRQ
ncbi:glutamine amidotransferase [Demequina sp. TTPB684]|uniref:glutamine amidotransferase-related protein n=1 Tax=unclassified Demequina TaxID=2620311 RepID=UPI001CF247AC|nr:MULTISPECIES: glutamine amidotransferase [unclassified Demequina]MCB2411992.1 glutamine amidotransferase [Demequina sp. TTPB684]UPU88456.1 glutamine amidotransferase [Demequina sp. TMPB413]